MLRLCSVGDYDEWVCSIGVKILTGEDWTIQRKVWPIATLSTTNLTWTDLGLNSGFCCEQLVAVRTVGWSHVALVSIVMNIKFPENAGNIVTGWAFLEGLCCEEIRNTYHNQKLCRVTILWSGFYTCTWTFLVSLLK